MADKEAQDQQYRRAVPKGLMNVKHIIAIGSGKGGVGKSTVATNLAMALKKAGARVGLMDADIYGPSQPSMLGAGYQEPKIMGEYLVPLEKYGLPFMSIGVLMEEDKPVIWRAPIATKMIMQFIGNVLWGELDYLLVDLPPGTGDVQITLAQQAHLTGAVIVTTPQQVALGVAKKGLQMFEQVNVPILGIIENMSGFVCPECGHNTPIFKEGGGKAMAEAFNVSYLGAVPLDPALMDAGDTGKPVTLSHPDSTGAKAFTELAKKFKTVVTNSGQGAVEEPKSIRRSKQGHMIIEWPDGNVSTLSAYDLRISCPCASCVDEDTGKRILDVNKVSLDIRVGAFEVVGRYALGLSFTDGHNTGIYRFELLKALGRKASDSTEQKFSV